MRKTVLILASDEAGGAEEKRHSERSREAETCFTRENNSSRTGIASAYGRKGDGGRRMMRWW